MSSELSLDSRKSTQPKIVDIPPSLNSELIGNNTFRDSFRLDSYRSSSNLSARSDISEDRRSAKALVAFISSKQKQGVNVRAVGSSKLLSGHILTKNGKMLINSTDSYDSDYQKKSMTWDPSMSLKHLQDYSAESSVGDNSAPNSLNKDQILTSRRIITGPKLSTGSTSSIGSVEGTQRAIERVERLKAAAIDKSNKDRISTELKKGGVEDTHTIITNDNSMPGSTYASHNQPLPSIITTSTLTNLSLDSHDIKFTEKESDHDYYIANHIDTASSAYTLSVLKNDLENTGDNNSYISSNSNTISILTNTKANSVMTDSPEIEDRKMSIGDHHDTQHHHHTTTTTTTNNNNNQHNSSGSKSSNLLHSQNDSQKSTSLHIDTTSTATTINNNINQQHNTNTNTTHKSNNNVNTTTATISTMNALQDPESARLSTTASTDSQPQQTSTSSTKKSSTIFNLINMFTRGTGSSNNNNTTSSNQPVTPGRDKSNKSNDKKVVDLTEKVDVSSKVSLFSNMRSSSSNHSFKDLLTSRSYKSDSNNTIGNTASPRSPHDNSMNIRNSINSVGSTGSIKGATASSTAKTPGKSSSSFLLSPFSTRRSSKVETITTPTKVDSTDKNDIPPTSTATTTTATTTTAVKDNNTKIPLIKTNSGNSTTTTTTTSNNIVKIVPDSTERVNMADRLAMFDKNKKASQSHMSVFSMKKNDTTNKNTTTATTTTTAVNSASTNNIISLATTTSNTTGTINNAKTSTAPTNLTTPTITVTTTNDANDNIIPPPSNSSNIITSPRKLESSASSLKKESSESVPPLIVPTTTTNNNTNSTTASNTALSPVGTSTTAAAAISAADSPRKSSLPVTHMISRFARKKTDPSIKVPMTTTTTANTTTNTTTNNTTSGGVASTENVTVKKVDSQSSISVTPATTTNTTTNTTNIATTTTTDTKSSHQEHSQNKGIITTDKTKGEKETIRELSAAEKQRDIPQAYERVNIAERLEMLQKEAETHTAENIVTLIHASNNNLLACISESNSSTQLDTHGNESTTDMNTTTILDHDHGSNENKLHNSSSSTNSGFKPIKNNFTILLERLDKKDETLTELIFNNNTMISQKDENFKLLADALINNDHITKIELINVNMKDEHCFILLEAWKTCTKLQKLNVETNMLTTAGVEEIAYMAEKHPALEELRVSNQRMAVGIDAERALANCVSQNTRIKKISHSFRENFVAVYVDKYIQRNLDLIRQQRLQNETAARERGVSNTPPLKLPPYPFPREASPLRRLSGAYTPLSRTPQNTSRSSTPPPATAENITSDHEITNKGEVKEGIVSMLTAESSKLPPNSGNTPPPLPPSTTTPITTTITSKDATTTAATSSSNEVMDNNTTMTSKQVTEDSEDTATLSIAERLALLKRQKDYRNTNAIPENEKMTGSVQDTLAILTKEKTKKEVVVPENERGNVAERLKAMRENAVKLSSNNSNSSNSNTSGGGETSSSSSIGNKAKSFSVNSNTATTTTASTDMTKTLVTTASEPILPMSTPIKSGPNITISTTTAATATVSTLPVSADDIPPSTSVINTAFITPVAASTTTTNTATAINSPLNSLITPIQDNNLTNVDNGNKSTSTPNTARRVTNNKINALAANIKIDALLPGAKLPSKHLNKTSYSYLSDPTDIHDLKITILPGLASESHNSGVSGVSDGYTSKDSTNATTTTTEGPEDGEMKHMNLSRPTCIRLRTKTRTHRDAVRGLMSIADGYDHVDVIPPNPHVLVSKQSINGLLDDSENEESVLSGASHLETSQRSKSHSLSLKDPMTHLSPNSDTTSPNLVSPISGLPLSASSSALDLQEQKKLRKSIRIDLLSQASQMWSYVNRSRGTSMSSLGSKKSNDDMRDLADRSPNVYYRERRTSSTASIDMALTESPPSNTNSPTKNT